MTYHVVSATEVPIGRGPHPAASPFDRRISDHLGITAFEIYQVELPANGLTVSHDHIDDQTEDVYAVISGTGWLVVGPDRVPVSPGQFMAVSLDLPRHLEAGPEGLMVIAVCAEQRT